MPSGDEKEKLRDITIFVEGTTIRYDLYRDRFTKKAKENSI
jgi:hypothetical protein